MAIETEIVIWAECDFPGCDEKLTGQCDPMDVVKEAHRLGWKIDWPHCWCPAHLADKPTVVVTGAPS